MQGGRVYIYQTYAKIFLTAKTSKICLVIRSVLVMIICMKAEGGFPVIAKTTRNHFYPSDGQVISANISGQGSPSLNLYHCLSDLLLIVDL